MAWPRQTAGQKLFAERRKVLETRRRIAMEKASVEAGAKAEASRHDNEQHKHKQDLSSKAGDSCMGLEQRMTVELLKHQRLALAWMLEREATIKGGILADDQGLGKTVSTIALLLKAGARCPEKKPKNGGTLIVCPLSVIGQWEREIATKVAKGSRLSTFVYHDSAKKGMTAEKLAKYDVVITTYTLVAREIPYKVREISPDDYGMELEKYVLPMLRKRMEKSYDLPTGPLGRVAWHRVVLDEAESVRNCATQASLSCNKLKTTYRWGLSGTPLQNNIKDLYAYFRFLRFTPLNSAAGFRPHFRTYSRTGDSAYLKEALEKITLRRTKSSVIDGEPVLNLPPRLVNRIVVRFGPREEELYANLKNAYKGKVDELKKKGTLKQNRVNLLVMLLRLRQLCDHPLLLSSLKATDPLFGQVSDDFELPLSDSDFLDGEFDGDAVTRKRKKDSSGLECLDYEFDRRQKELKPYEQLRKKIKVESLNEEKQEPVKKFEKKIKHNEFEVARKKKRDSPDLYIVDELPLNQRGADYTVRKKEAEWRMVKHESDDEKIKVETFEDDVVIIDDDMTEDADLYIVEDGGEEKKVELRPSFDDHAVTRKRKNKEISSDSESDDKFDVDETMKQKDLRKNEQKPGNSLYGEFMKEIKEMESSKLKAAMELLRLTPADEKTLIFSQWTGLLDLFEPELERVGIKFSRVDGTMNMAKRESEMDKFKEDPEVRVMLLSLKAAGCGLNLTAATRVLLFDMWWNPTTEEQAIDRTHRIGQTRPVHVTKFIVEETAEEKILAIQERKRKLVKFAFGDHHGEENNLTIDEIVSMFE